MAFFKYQTESVQEFRFALSEQIRKQVFYAILVEKVETSIKSNGLIDAINSWFRSRNIIYKVVKWCFISKFIIHPKVPCALFYFSKRCKVVYELFK